MRAWPLPRPRRTKRTDGSYPLQVGRDVRRDLRNGRNLPVADPRETLLLLVRGRAMRTAIRESGTSGRRNHRQNHTRQVLGKERTRGPAVERNTGRKQTSRIRIPKAKVPLSKQRYVLRQTALSHQENIQGVHEQPWVRQRCRRQRCTAHLRIQQIHLSQSKLRGAAQRADARALLPLPDALRGTLVPGRNVVLLHVHPAHVGGL
mmetsp:Transcript_8848/g.54444  ORF Transcript_8848/g.54444 Transcript_8848/m.54444 type:complete len:205 (+) Transcript_8848:294-908(+)